MKSLTDSRKPRRCADKIALVATSAVAILAIIAVAVGCGSAGKNGSTASSSGTGQHDTGIAYVKVLPSDKMLKEGVMTTINLRSNLAFVVGVKNGGDYLEKNVKVTLVIHQNSPNSSITKTMSIANVHNGSTQEADFRGPFIIRTMIAKVPIKVSVAPVTGEPNKANNEATYEVLFAF